MILTGKTLNHINTITHDGKVLCFGTDEQGGIYYTVKRSGFENSAISGGADPFGFEDWKGLRLGESLSDPSVTAFEQQELSDGSGKVLVRSVYGSADEVTKSSAAPVQLVSAFGHLFVFRQSPGGKILVTRFVLDGLTNELVPRLDVRFRRSRQRLAPAAAVSGGDSFDTLDYRDINGNSFYEPAIELGFVDAVSEGRFAVLLTPTAESDRSRWHIFVYDGSRAKLVLYTIGATANGLFDVKDYRYGYKDSGDPDTILYRTIPGIVRRTIDMPGFSIAGGPTATTYDLQKEQMTDAGPLLVRDRIRVMLAVPVQATSSNAVRTAAISFALAADGTLSQIDPTPDDSTLLRSKARDVMVPPSLLDGIKEFADATPAPAGVIVATERGGSDQLQIRSRDPLPQGLTLGDQISVRGTSLYDGKYKVLSVDGNTFQVAATWQGSEAGFWEVLETPVSGLVYEDMIVGCEKTEDGKLKILCPAHDLQVDDEVQISGTRAYNGTFSVAAIDTAGKSFVLDAPYFTGQAANLSKVVRHGLRMSSGDRIETPELALRPPSPSRALGRTVSVWVRMGGPLPTDVTEESQVLAMDGGGMMRLGIGAQGNPKLTVQMSDGTVREVIDPVPLPIDKWVHLAGILDYSIETGGKTTLALCRNGVAVAQTTAGHLMPCHLGTSLIAFDGSDDYVSVPPSLASFAQGITMEAWVYLEDPGQPSVDRSIFTEKRPAGGDVQFCIKLNGTTHVIEAGFYVQTSNQWFTRSTAAGLPLRTWNHVAASYDGHTVRIYLNGVLTAESPDFNRPLPPTNDGYYIGRRHDIAPIESMFKGHIADVRLWNRVRSAAEITEQLTTRLRGREAGLVGYWPLDSGLARDLSPAKLHGTLQGSPASAIGTYLHPQIVPPPASGATRPAVMSFDGLDDYIEIPDVSAGFAAGFTISAWVKIMGGRDTFRSVVTCRRGGVLTFEGFTIYAQQNNQWAFWAADGTDWKILDTGVPVVEGVWVHLACTVTATGITGYVNGTARGSKACNYRAASRPMRIGAGATEGSPQFFVNGAIGEVQLWTAVRSEAEIKAGMYRRLSGMEPNLFGYWPLDRDASDLSPKRRSGTISGSPKPAAFASAHVLGKGVEIELADAQIWDQARLPDTIQATMNLPLSGKEQGLVAGYRLGAIVKELEPPAVSDYSVNGRHGIAIGSPYVGARTLHRQSGGKKVIRFGSDDLCAVSQRGVYEESFEFRVTSADSAFNPNQVASGRLFTFTYWGKSSQSSDELIAFPLASVQQADFTSLGGGWYKASCRVTIPDGVSLMRVFEISQLRGLWGSEVTPPASEWTAIDIRRHRIRLISDAITRDSYTDTLALAALPAQRQDVIDAVRDFRQKESTVARLEATIADLLARIDIAGNQAQYIAQRQALIDQKTTLGAQKTQKEGLVSSMSISSWNRYQNIQSVSTGKYIRGTTGTVNQTTAGASTASDTVWWFMDRGGGNYHICLKDNGYALTARPQQSGSDPPFLTVSPLVLDATSQLWKVSSSGTNQASYVLESVSYTAANSHSYAARPDPQGTDGQLTVAYKNSVPDADQKWLTIVSGTINASAQATITGLSAEIAELNRQMLELQNTIDFLTAATSGAESVTSLTNKKNTVQIDLNNARTALSAQTAVAMGLLRQSGQFSQTLMPAVARDERGLETTAAVLDFAQPAGRVRLTESCEGNVLLTYFDRSGRLRATAFDAVADSRNSTFEQWLPDALRACVDLRDASDSITLASPVTLPASGWTCEAWAQFPFAATSSGSAYEYNVIGAATAQQDATLIVKRGNRLGVMIEGCFFDSGIDLSRTILPGWHHFAASTSAEVTSFYINGNKVASRSTVQPRLRFNSATDFVEVPAHASPTAALTLSAFARIPSATSPCDGTLVSKRDAFLFGLYPGATAGTRNIVLSVFVSSSWRPVVYQADFQNWHFYTATFDGAELKLYIDGELVTKAPLGGTINADSGVMHLGHDELDASPLRSFDGEIAEIAYFQTARSASDIRSDNSNTVLLGRSLSGTESGLIGYWRMLPDSSATPAKVVDLSPQKRDGVVRGAPTNLLVSTKKSLDATLIGNRAGGGSPAGRLAEVRMWSPRLSDVELGVHARFGVSGFEPGLIAYYPLNEADGATVLERSYSGPQGTCSGVDWVPNTGNLGHPGSKVLSLSEQSAAWVDCPPVALHNRSFSIECWARRSGPRIGSFQSMVSMGVSTANLGLQLAIRENNKVTFDFFSNAIDSPSTYTDTDWHHVCGTYDLQSQTQRLYVDGQLVVEKAGAAPFAGSGSLAIGRHLNGADLFCGELAELRIWSGARTGEQIRAQMHRRATGTEADLLICYPLDGANGSGVVLEKKGGTYAGRITNPGQMLISSTLPLGAGHSLVATEYSTVDLSSDGKRQAMMRRSYSYASGGVVTVLPEQRLETLALQWIGNTQLAPTLLGYIEGAPPVPSENFTLADDYDGATSVTLRTSADTSYSWQRSENSSSGVSSDLFLGIAWSVSAEAGFLGNGISATVMEGQMGMTAGQGGSSQQSASSAVEATSSLRTTDTLKLSGMSEERVSLAQIGKRWIPKNLGYAQVISGTADLFVTRLLRSGRMVSYEVRPVEGLPLDVNTITFMINPAYTLNGSLDGLVGSSPADAGMYQHVPQLRAQVGSQYPASYFRMREAYALKDRIERQDKDRESFFQNFQTRSGDPQLGAIERRDTLQKLLANAGVERATSAFSAWQSRMEDIMLAAGKRNVVNTYVWDGDGGMRAEEQSFASTIEHSISSASIDSASSGFVSEQATYGIKISQSFVSTASIEQSAGKTQSSSKSLELSVDLSGVERNGITDVRDNPLRPGEKVDRYRFMTFYLEGSTNHFDDFFRVVVDPVWLTSNTEEARALRQARAAKPNKCWRVLHRVTYVERPMLAAAGLDMRTLSSMTKQGTTTLSTLNAKVDSMQIKLDTKLSQILNKLP